MKTYDMIGTTIMSISNPIVFQGDNMQNSFYDLDSDWVGTDGKDSDGHLNGGGNTFWD